VKTGVFEQRRNVKRMRDKTMAPAVALSDPRRDSPKRGGARLFRFNASSADRSPARCRAF